MPSSKWLYAGILAAGAAANALLSPKWAMPVFAWVAPGCLLFYFRYAGLRLKIPWFVIALLASQLISDFNVFPFPWPVMAVLIIINMVKVLLIFLIDSWANKKSTRFVTTLVFPAAYVAKEFFDVSFSGGTWWSIANSQYSFQWLAQLSSVTGLAGISFMVYWFASAAVWALRRYYTNTRLAGGLIWYTGVFAAVLLFGTYRFYSNANTQSKQVKIAGISVPTTGLLEAVYKDVTGQTVHVDLKTSIVSKQLQQVNAAIIPFIENPDTAKFINGYKALYALNDSLFAESKKAAGGGAKIITWSEANAIMPVSMQDAFIKRGQGFAKNNKVYLLMALGVFDTGKITAGKMFLQNKTILISPGGDILNVFYKNHPVPYAERSKPGNGKIPVVATPYGRLSVSICYDADMPAGMRQLGREKSGMLFLPSGDWYAIAPYHTYMAAFRGIENGCTVIRQARGGLSLVTDYRGRQQASFDFYKPGEKLWIANIITGHVDTIYSTIGEAFAYVCIGFTSVVLGCLFVSLFLKKKEVKVGTRMRRLQEVA
jgi:apolipoprotein N-acyltransferase